MNLNAIIKNAIELAAKHGEAKRAQALNLQELKADTAKKEREHEKYLEELKESGRSKRKKAELTSAQSLAELTKTVSNGPGKK